MEPMMSKILYFPTTKKIRPVQVRSSRQHAISFEIIDRSAYTRHKMQFFIQRVAGCGRSLKGLTDAAVANGYRHRFDVSSTAAARRFATMTAPLIASGKITVWIDRSLVRPQPALVA
jgi:hypothetical protein